jgi:hypothetical protein
MVERKRAGYFTMKHKMAHEEYKNKREEERAQKHEKARHPKEARHPKKALITHKWPRLTQD